MLYNILYAERLVGMKKTPMGGGGGGLKFFQNMFANLVSWLRRLRSVKLK